MEITDVLDNLSTSAQMVFCLIVKYFQWNEANNNRCSGLLRNSDLLKKISIYIYIYLANILEIWSDKHEKIVKLNAEKANLRKNHPKDKQAVNKMHNRQESEYLHWVSNNLRHIN